MYHLKHPEILNVRNFPKSYKVDFLVKLRSDNGHQVVLGNAFLWAYDLKWSLSDIDQIRWWVLVCLYGFYVSFETGTPIAQVGFRLLKFQLSCYSPTPHSTTFCTSRILEL